MPLLILKRNKIFQPKEGGGEAFVEEGVIRGNFRSVP